jgi:hypothetical protein
MNKPIRRWQAIGGYIADICRFARAKLENPHSYLKFLHLKQLQKQTGAEVLIETGTYLGVTSYRCSFVYEQVFTVELSTDLAAAAKKFLSWRRNVEVICGDAVTELPRIFQQNSIDRAVVFLDGHYSGGETATGAISEPVLEELQGLGPFTERIVAIVVDDFRTFGTTPGTPSKSKLLRTCEELLSGYDVTVAMDQLTLLRQNLR